ncbi:MAG: nickel pincer cofactor biosynthesis protein LarB [Pirellulales bacterium]
MLRREEIELWARELLAGRATPDQLADALSGDKPTSAELADATLDLDRQRRCGFPEVVYGEGKSVETLVRIFTRLLQEDIEVFATRITSEKAEQLRTAFPSLRYNPLARTLRLSPGAETSSNVAGTPSKRGRVVVVTAGTSDLPVAEEALETLDWMGVDVELVQDVGVAGPHRLPARLGSFRGADAVVVVAGMEGALPSVVGGYVDCPVVGVPTSVGYGANFGGLSSLLSMLNSCASNVVVVNIDAGFKGGYVAGMIARGRGKESA